MIGVHHALSHLTALLGSNAGKDGDCIIDLSFWNNDGALVPIDKFVGKGQDPIIGVHYGNGTSRHCLGESIGE